MAKPLYKPVSASRMNAYFKCGYQFLKMKVLKEYTEEPRIYLSRGSTLHSVIEAFFSTGLWVPDYRIKDMEKLTFLYTNYGKEQAMTFNNASFLEMHHFDKAFNVPYPNLSHLSPEIKTSLILHALHLKKWQEDAFTLLKDTKPSFEFIRDTLDDWDILVEDSIRIAENRSMLPTAGFSDSHWADAKIDFLAVKGDKAIVLDWKSGEFKPKYTADSVTQVTFYAALVMDKYPQIAQVHAGVYHPFTDKKGFISNAVSRNSPEHLGTYAKIAQVERAVTHYETTGLTTAFPKIQSPLCAFCQVADCEFKK